jgi:hypothetical protein
MGAGEAGERFPQQPAGKETSATKWIGGIDGHDIEIAGQAAVLEAVVEQRDLRPRGRGRLDAGDAVAVGDVRHGRQQDGQFGRLVAPFAAGSAVATAHDGGLEAARCKSPRQPGHQRRLASAAEREVANRNDRYRPLGGRQQVEIVGRISAADHQAIGGREAGQSDAGQCWPHPAGRPVHQTLECLGVGEQGH